MNKVLTAVWSVCKPVFTLAQNGCNHIHKAGVRLIDWLEEDTTKRDIKPLKLPVVEHSNASCCQHQEPVTPAGVSTDQNLNNTMDSQVADASK